MQRRLFKLLLIVLTLLLAAMPSFAQDSTTESPVDLDGDGVNLGFPEPDPFDVNSYIRFAHFAPDAGDVDIYLNGEMVEGLSGVSYETLGEWMPVAPGGYDIDVTPAGESIDSAVVDLESFQLTRGQWLTAAVVIDNEGTPAVVTAVEDFSRPLPGATNVTFFNALSTEDNVDFNRDGVPFVINLGRNDNEINSYSYAIPMDTAEYSFSANETLDNTVVSSDMSVDFNEWSSYLIAVYGNVDGDPQLLIDETSRVEYANLRGELPGDGTVVDAMSYIEELRPYVRLIDEAGLNETLSGEGPFTVFIPAGFLADEILLALDEDTTENFLLSHVYAGEALYTQDLIEADSLITEAGNEIPVIVEGDAIYVGGARVIDVNIPATNGVIHVVGYVIDPTLDQEDYDIFDDATNLRANADLGLSNDIEEMSEEATEEDED